MKDDSNPYAPPAAEPEQENPGLPVTRSPAGNEKRWLNNLIDLGVCGFVLLPAIFALAWAVHTSSKSVWQRFADLRSLLPEP